MHNLVYWPTVVDQENSLNHKDKKVLGPQAMAASVG